MWSPQGHYSWNDLVNHFIETSEEILSLVAIGGEPRKQPDGKQYLFQSAEFYLKSRGVTTSYTEGELTVCLTACFLMSKFLEDYPPVLASLNGNLVTASPFLFEHKDQFHYCYYVWPLSADSQFSNFFEFCRKGAFQPADIFERFAFIDPRSGEICLKNGSRAFLKGYVFESSAEVDRALALVKKLSEFVVCWPSLPDGSEFRNFLSYLEVNDIFTKALDFKFGLPVEAEEKPEPKPRRAGRPEKQGAARQAYWELFPEGHEKSGKVWKEAHEKVEKSMGIPIDISTLKRAVRPGGQKTQN